MDRGDLEIPLPSVQFWELKTALKKLSLKKLLKGTEGSNEEGLTAGAKHPFTTNQKIPD